jgi:hypothetical protein
MFGYVVDLVNQVRVRVAVLLVTVLVRGGGALIHCRRKRSDLSVTTKGGRRASDIAVALDTGTRLPYSLSLRVKVKQILLASVVEMRRIGVTSLSKY